MENMMTKTIAVLKSDFDAKIARLQQLAKPHSFGATTNSEKFIFQPVQSILQLEQLDESLKKVEYAQKFVITYLAQIKPYTPLLYFFSFSR